MTQRRFGLWIALLILIGVATVLLTNLNLGGRASRSAVDRSPTSESLKENARPADSKAFVAPAGFHEVPIGEFVKADPPYHLRIDAVWLPSVEWDGSRAVAGLDVIHLEADVKATERNPHGFAKGAFLPYLKIAYRIVGEGGATISSGELLPMVALDGPHYGASVSLPKAGAYRLILNVRPPSAGGLGRHTDPITGVPAWWPSFQADFDWDYDPKAAK